MRISVNYKKLNLYIKKQGFIYTIKKCLGQIIWTLLYPILKSYYSKMAISKDQILFISKPDYSDNALYLFDYLLNRENSAKYSYVWLLAEESKSDHNDEIQRVTFINEFSSWHLGLSQKAIKAVLTSEYVFFTHDSPLHDLQKKPEQIVVNLWHGCGYKSMKSTNEWSKKNPFDYALVPGKVFIETKSVFWACDKKKILPIGYPRYDEFKHVSSATNVMFKALKGKADKLIMWMPTYRKTESGTFAVNKIKGFFELPILKSTDDLLMLDQYCFENNIVICIKRHKNQIRFQSEDIKLKSIKFITDADLKTSKASLYSLLSCIDGLITDYSSVAIDFLLVNKPIGFTLDDFQEYRDTQGFVFPDPLKYMPGTHIYSYDDLLGFIYEIIRNEDKHKAERKAIMDDVHNPCDNYCERIWNKVLELSSLQK